ncbi:MerR family transcriptional regulator, partial [Mammaliicoccus sciuri]|uniref:MerR family transcriptional regulator n=2 Tax=Mammaliicoccus sciuri TaxID=1296 RepID=UPI0034DD5D08
DLSLCQIKSEMRIFMSYSIGEVSKITDMSIHALRFYEKKGLIKPFRNEQNHRTFSDNDLLKIQMIKNFKHISTPIEDINRFFSLFENDDSTEIRRQFLLSEEKRINDNIQKLQEGKKFLKKILDDCYS